MTKQGNPYSLFQWHNLNLSCKTRLKWLHILWEELPTQRRKKPYYLWEEESQRAEMKGTEISVVSSEELDPTASKNVQNFLEHIWILYLKWEEWEDMKSDMRTPDLLALLTVCAGSTSWAWSFQILVPATRLWEGARITGPVFNGSWQGAAAQPPSSLAKFPLLLWYGSKCFRSGGSPASHHPGVLESQSWLISVKRGESKNTGVFYLPAVSGECIPFQ